MFTSIIKGLMAAFISVSALFGGHHSVIQPNTTNTSLSATVQASSQSSSSQSNAAASATTTTSSGSTVTNASLPSGSSWQTTLPLGDGLYTTSGAKKGYIYICRLTTGGNGAEGRASWINGSSWIPSEKVAVQGNVAWPNATYAMTISGNTRSIIGNGLPTDHNTGVFPIAYSDPAHQFDGNPNSILAQNYNFSLPVSPTMLTKPDCILGQVGIMNDGVALFDGFDAEYRDAVAHETQDAWEAHPDGPGTYHYHGFEGGFVKDAISKVVGFAFDGYPITGSLLPNGNYVHTADLDECHGMTSTITLDGKSVSSYHYVLTQDFPYSVSCFRGKSYEPRPNATGAGQGGQTSAQAGMSATPGSGTPPQAAITACSNKTVGNICSFSAPNGTINGSCRMPPSSTSLACVPN